MYSLDINFLKDRPEYQPKVKRKITIALPVGNLTPVYLGVSISVFFPLLAGLSLWFLQAKNSELEQNIARLEQEKQQLDQQIGSINKIKEETNAIKRETQSLVGVFDQIRPWSAMLQDLRDRIPATVQIQEIKQTPPAPADKGQPPSNLAGGIELSGFAPSFNDVNDFLLSIQQSRFLKSTETKLITSELVDAPLSELAIPSITGVPIKPPQIVKYTIQSSLSDVPASELIRELEQKGTVGLVARLRSLQQTGVIKK